MKYLDKVVELATRLFSVKNAFTLFLAAGALTYMPERWLVAMKLEYVAKSYRDPLAVLFLVSGARLLTPVIFWGGDRIRRATRQALQVRKGQGRLQHLSPDERELLVPFVQTNGRMQRFPPMQGTANRLVAEDILFRPVRLVNLVAPSSPFCIQPWALEYLQEHPELVGLRKTA
jgi:hypothetical protein